MVLCVDTETANLSQALERNIAELSHFKELVKRVRDVHMIPIGFDLLLCVEFQ